MTRRKRPAGMSLAEAFEWFMPGCPPEDGSCWEWPGESARNGQDYGVFRMPDGTRLAHRASFELFVGKITEEDCVLHTCDNPPCVNPMHLFLGTRPDNSADKVSKGRQARGTRAGGAKLSDDQVREIRRLHAEGVGYRQLAPRFEVSKSTIRRVVVGEGWTHV